MAFFEHMLLHSPNYLSLLPPWPWHTVESSSGVCQPQPQPRPVFSAASTSCLQEGQAATPSFHFLWCSLSLGVLEWTGPPQAWRLGNHPPRSLGNWSHPLPLVSCPWTVECVVGCRLLPESCSYTLFTGPAVRGGYATNTATMSSLLQLPRPNGSQLVQLNLVSFNFLCDMWHVTRDTWQVTHDMWLVTHDT